MLSTLKKTVTSIEAICRRVDVESARTVERGRTLPHRADRRSLANGRASRLIGTVVASGEQRACWDSDRPLLEQLIELLGVAWQGQGGKPQSPGPVRPAELPGAIEGS